MSDGRIDSVAHLQGCGDIERIANGRDYEGFGPMSPHYLDPERQQAAYPRVLQNEKRAAAILTIEYFLGASAEHIGNGRGIPLPVQGTPVAPGGAGGRENFVVQQGNLQGFPMPGLVGGIGAYKGRG